MEQIIVIGHKNHDTDSIVGSIALAAFKNAQGMNFIAVRNQDTLWEESLFLLKRFGFELPEFVADLSGKKVFFVDHNEESQWNTGVSAENIIGIIDHHKFNFTNKTPIPIINEPVGSTCTILAHLFLEQNVALTKNMAGLLLGGILSDTDNQKSPTTTKKDKDAVVILAQKSGEDPEQLFKHMFEAQSKLDEKTDKELFDMDFKLFENPKGTIGIGQIKVMDNTAINERKSSMLTVMEKTMQEEKCLTVMLMVTNIKDEATDLWVVGDQSIAQRAFNKPVENNSIFLPGVLSRKMQITPFLTPILS